MIYLPSISADYEQIFIYEIEDSAIQWDEDEKCWFIDFSDEDYSIGETILLDKSDKTLLLEDYLIEFKTNLSEIYKRPEITSEVVSKDDVLNFFKNPFMSKEQIEAQEEEAEKEPLYTYRLSYPNKIIIDFKNPVDIATINPDNFDIEISEAFGNYHLGKMGYYDECISDRQ